MVHGSSKPVTIRGINYPSLTAAASALGVSVGSVSLAVKRGTEDTIGLGFRKQADLECDGVIYTNVRELAQAIGHTPASVYLALSRKTKDEAGYVLLNNHRIKRLAKPAATQDRGK